MLSLISTLGGLLISGLPKLLEYFQDKADKKHELALAQMQTEREMALAKEGFIAQAKMEEIRTDQVAMQTEAQTTVAAYDHDKAVLSKAASWVSSYVGTVRPTVTYIFVLELVLVNVALTVYMFTHPTLIQSVDDLIKYADIVFSDQELSMLAGIIGFWFGSRNWGKK